jgi:N6-adenosine-specific RNA methylase IME4
MRFEVLLIDCPWHYNQRTCSKTRFGTGVHGHYPTMKLEEIKRLPINALAAPNAVLFMWATFPRLDAALEVIKAWGFRYKTLGFNYVKLNPKNGQPFFGVGYFAKSGSEVCLLATRGKVLKSVSANLNSIGDESAGQTQKSVATLSSFFPVGDETAETIQPGVGAFHHPAPRLSALVW